MACWHSLDALGPLLGVGLRGVVGGQLLDAHLTCPSVLLAADGLLHESLGLLWRQLL